MPEGFEETFLPPPPEFKDAPSWAVAMWYQNRRDQHKNAAALMVLQGRVLLVENRLGTEPDSDGRGGKGLIGDVRALMALKLKGLGFLAAIVLTGAILVYGLIYWIQSIVGKVPGATAKG
jgi:hypothetical protein